MTTNRPADCVCNLGHCHACLAAGILCDRPGCKMTRADGVPCAERPTRRAPAMPQPELVDEEERAPELHDDCARALAAHDSTPAIDIEADLRASLRPAPKPPSLLTAKERTARAERHEARAQLARLRVGTESYPARALSMADLDAHERSRFSMRGRV
jgi:hypothetical protein